jgi:ribose/xylose/arabinose/galactoside ABC-type transport system permease subunit
MRFREMGMVVVLAVLYFSFAIVEPNMLKFGTFTTVLQQVSPVAIAGAWITLVMVAGSLDLSVGGSIALSGVMTASVAASGTPVPIALFVGVLIGGLVGVINSILVVRMKINSVIATLGTLYVAHGIAFLKSNGLPQYTIPQPLITFGNGFSLDVPNPVWVMVVVVLLAWAVQRFTTLGRYSVAIGSNESAARLSGIRVDRIRVILFIAAGLSAGLAGAVLAGQFNGDPNVVNEGWEFSVIVAAVLGGTSLSGGRGTVFGTLIGASIVGVLAAGLTIVGVNSFWQYVIEGIVLVAAVALDNRLRLLKRRQRPEREMPIPAGKAVAGGVDG